MNNLLHADQNGLPTVIVPYPGPTEEEGVQDIFVYLRPETNGIKVESTMLKFIKSNQNYTSSMKLIYLANFPGEFIASNHIVEQYYALRLHFSLVGASAFTADMISAFEDHFQVKFNSCEILGAFTALERFGMQSDELFDFWVPEQDLCNISGQIIKKIRGVYVINYDMPSLIHKNNQKTDIAVMIFRTKLDCASLKNLFVSMHKAVVNANIINAKYDMSRAYHYSRGPFDQVLDGISYLYTENRKNINLNDLTFARYLIEKGCSEKKICELLMNPIVVVGRAKGGSQEVNLLQYTSGKSYAEAYSVLQDMLEQRIIIHHGPLLQAICPCT